MTAAMREMKARKLKEAATSTRFKRYVQAGKRNKDQLLRALVPLFLSVQTGLPALGLRITSGDTEKFWKSQGVKFQAPNVARALREHVGYSRRTKTGLLITPNGLRYVAASVKP